MTQQNKLMKRADAGQIWLIKYFLETEDADGNMYDRLYKIDVWAVTDEQGCFDFSAYDFNCKCNITVSEMQKLLDHAWIAENAEMIYE